jgi:5-methylcytosine-specific restriction endonuclease McrA
MATKPRDYAREYALFQGTPAQIAKRSTRNSARRVYEKANGNLPSTVDVDHIKPLSKGGKPVALSNLRAASESANRSFARNKDNSLKSQESKRESKK